MKCLILLALSATLAAAQYEGHTLLQLQPEHEWQSRILRDTMLNDVELDFWTEPTRTNDPVDILVPAHKLAALRTKTRALKIHVTVLDNNIQGAVDSERKRLAKRSMDVNLDEFNDYDAIASWLNDLPASCPSGLSCSVRNIGSTYEGRDMLVFTMSTGSGQRGVWIDSAIHAREWLAPATTIKILDRMLNGYGNDNEVTTLLNKHDFHFLPVMNPDGYQYSFTSGNRLHRKNRAPNSGSSCLGTDLNRNYNWMWAAEGVSTNPCSDLFCGSSAGSELETQAVQDEGGRLSSSLDAWLTFHSYGYMWMHPWGNTVGNNGNQCERASDHAEMYVLADATANSIENVLNTRWARGTSCEVIYETTGATDDYMKGVHGVKFPVCPELRGNSFIVDPSQIDLSYQEIWAGIVTMCDRL